jgi:hypothetical protein
MQSYFPDSSDSLLALCEHWASAAATLGSSSVSSNAACAAWQEVLCRPGGATNWPAQRSFLAWQTRFGGAEAARAAYWQLLSRRRNAPPATVAAEVTEALLDFEVMFGSAHDEQKAHLYLSKMQAAAAAAQAAACKQELESQGPQVHKRHQPEASAPEDSGVLPTEGKGAKRARTREKQSDSREHGKARQEQAHFTDENTLFVKHLSDSVTAEDLKKLFQVSAAALWVCYKVWCMICRDGLNHRDP